MVVILGLSPTGGAEVGFPPLRAMALPVRGANDAGVLGVVPPGAELMAPGGGGRVPGGGARFSFGTGISPVPDGGGVGLLTGGGAGNPAGGGGTDPAPGGEPGGGGGMPGSDCPPVNFTSGVPGAVVPTGVDLAGVPRGVPRMGAASLAGVPGVGGGVTNASLVGGIAELPGLVPFGIPAEGTDAGAAGMNSLRSNG